MSFVTVTEDLTMFSWNRLGYAVIAGLMLTLAACSTKPQPQSPTENVEPKGLEQAPPSMPEVTKVQIDPESLFQPESYAFFGSAKFLFTHQDRAIGLGMVTCRGPSADETGKPVEGKPLPLNAGRSTQTPKSR